MNAAEESFNSQLRAGQIFEFRDEPEGRRQSVRYYGKARRLVERGILTPEMFEEMRRSVDKEGWSFENETNELILVALYPAVPGVVKLSQVRSAS